MKLPDKLTEDIIAPCGVNCLACSAYLDDRRSCPGCHAPTEEITRNSCKNCAAKKCAFDQGLRWCFECGCFPCARIKNLSRRYQQNYNVDLIQNGIDARQDMAAFLRAQKERFTCKYCGGVTDQHHRRCSECGRNA